MDDREYELELIDRATPGKPLYEQDPPPPPGDYYELIVTDPNTDNILAIYEYDTREDAEYDAIGYEDEEYITHINHIKE